MIVAIVGARERSNYKSKVDFNTIKGDEVRRIMENMVSVMQENSALGASIRAAMQKDYHLLTRLLTYLHHKYSGNLSVLSVGCDDGIGAIVKAVTMSMRIRFVEVTCHFWDPPVINPQLEGDRNRRSRSEYLQFYNARNAYLDDIADEFHMLVNTSRHSMVENLYERIQQTTPIRPTVRPYALYDVDGKVLETNMQQMEGLTVA